MYIHSITTTQQQHEIIDNDGPPAMAPVAVAALLKPLLPYIDPLGVWPLSMLFIPFSTGGGRRTEDRNFDHCVIFVRSFTSKIEDLKRVCLYTIYTWMNRLLSEVLGCPDVSVQ
jgi:hypothetical protein